MKLTNTGKSTLSMATGMFTAVVLLALIVVFTQECGSIARGMLRTIALFHLFWTYAFAGLAAADLNDLIYDERSSWTKNTLMWMFWEAYLLKCLFKHA